MIWLRCLIFLGFGFSWVFADTTTIKTPEDGSKKVYDWPKECNGGQGYWCQNLNAAHDCQALPHCAQAVWQNQLMTVKDESPACENCVKYITEFQDFSTNNMTIQQLEISLELVCDFIPQSLIAKECELAVRKVMPDMEHYIKSIKPSTFCSTIFLCNAATSNKKYLEFKNIRIPKVETKTKESKAANSEIKPKPEAATSDNSKDLSPSVKSPQEFNCSSCYILLATSNKMVKHSSRDDILNRMIEICGKMSSFSDICSTNVITHFNEIYNFLLKLNPEEGCHLAGVCNNIYHIHGLTEDLKTAVARAPEEANDEVCDFCVAMVQHLKDIVISKSSEQEFKLVLLNICKQTGSFEEECTQLVNQYYTLIYQFLVEELKGDELCKDFKLCNSKIQGIDEEVPLWPLVPSELNLDELLKNETRASNNKPAIHSVQLTKTLTEFSKPLHLVGDSRCTWGPSYWCTNMATSKECPGTLKHCIHEVWEKQVLPADNGDICKICRDMVQQARDQLLSNETQDELRQVFEGSCALIPVKVAKEECVKVVDNFVPELVEALSSQMNPQVVCATVGLCNSAKMDLLLQKEKLEKSDEKLNMPLLPLPIDRMFPEFIQNQPLKAEIEKRGKEACELCELLLHYVQQQITLPKSEQEIKKVIDQVCVKLPDRVANKCSEFILEYGDDFISLLAQQIDPSTVCPSIGACPAFLTFVDNVKPTCPLCLLAVEAAENKLTNNKTEASVIKAFDNLCDDLPQNMQPACKTFIKDSLDKLVDSLMADFSSQETCYYLHLCGTDVGHGSVSIDISKETSVPSIVTNDVHPAVVKGDDQKCVLCEFIISKLEKELQDNKTEAEIRHAFNTVCNHMPKTTVIKCKKFVTDYLDLILDLVTKSVGPKEICTELHVCDKELLSTVVESDITVDSSASQVAEEQIDIERRLNLFIFYICAAAFVCALLIVFSAFKIRKAYFRQNPPYSRVTK